MLFALSSPDPAKLAALVGEMDKLRAAAKKQGLAPTTVPPLTVDSLSFSTSLTVDGKAVLLVDGKEDLSHAAWTAALRAGFDVRGGHIPTESNLSSQ